MRIARNAAALLALGALAFAVGDWASHPNAVGAAGLLVLAAMFAFLLSYLFRPADRPQRPKRAPKASRRSRAAAPVTAGWGAEEASFAREQRRLPRGGSVNLNSAREEEIAALPGVGRLGAAKIVAEREARGPFATVSDLARVPGFDPGKVRALAGRARVDG